MSDPIQRQKDAIAALAAEEWPEETEQSPRQEDTDETAY